MVSAIYRTVEREQNRDPVVRAYMGLAAAVLWQAAVDVWAGPGEANCQRTRDYHQAREWLFSPGYETMAAALGFDPEELRRYVLRGDRRGVFEYLADLKARARQAGISLRLPYYGDRRCDRGRASDVSGVR